MGIFNFFKKDPQQLLDQAERLIQQGEPERALRQAQDVLGNGSPALSGRAESLVRQAREAIVEAALQKAERAEESGYIDDAAEWILSVMEHVENDEQRRELQERADQFKEQAEKETQEKLLSELATSARPGGPATPADLDHQYEALIGMLDDDVESHYKNRPVIFKRAYVWLNEGSAEEAWEALEGLTAADPGDPVLRLERGRCRLMLAEPELALEDFEAVWETFGDEPLDVAATISVPTLWAEAMLALKRPAELVERLAAVSDPAEGDIGLCHRYALALVAAEDHQGAETYIQNAREHFPKDPEFPHLLAGLFQAAGRSVDAIDTLEEQIRPACTGPNCSRHPLYIPSVRSLAGLYLDENRNIERARELVELIAVRQGTLRGEDFLLLAEYHERSGDPEAAAEATAEAKRLKEEGEELIAHEQQNPLQSNKKAALG